MSDKNNNKLEAIRHSLSHLMSMAISELYPKVGLGVGPAIENGFYQDYGLEEALRPEILPKLEKRMKEMIKEKIKFEPHQVSFSDALKFYKHDPYKTEMIKELKAEGEKDVTFYKSGWFDNLCAGPHVKSTKEINPDAFKLTHIAGAYWRGSEDNEMLTRIYGVAFSSKKELDDYLKMMEEAEKRDHRKIGKDLEIFDFSEEIGAGLPLWLPKGTIIREQLENWAKETEESQGYVRVATPHITKSKLFYISGHLPHYAEDMYAPFKIEEEEYYLKPMNCPFHHMIYKSKPRSYKDLPLRIAEYGTVYRYELSGVLNGLMRVRGLTQNDAHIYCTLAQAKKEFLQVMKLHQFYYEKLGITDYYMELALRDPKNKEKYHGDDAMWDLAEKLTRQAMEESKIPYKEAIGEAAFYGPKIDFIIKTAVGKEYAISTNQLDLYMAKRFGLEYIDEKGKKQTPAIIHRAPLGTHERFIAFLLEHYFGAFPVWLSPVQVKIISVGKAHIDYCQKLRQDFREHGIRVEVDDENETVGNKIRKAVIEKVPYALVIGDKEMESGKLAVRERGEEKIRMVDKEEFIKEVLEKVKEKK